MIPTTLKCPKCGKPMVIKEGLEGVFCEDEKCGYYSPDTPSQADIITDVKQIFSEDRLKPLRGVPCDTFIVGSETKGRLQIQIPVGCSKTERRLVIDSALDDMEYLKSEIDKRQLDIYTTRGMKQ